MNEGSAKILRRSRRAPSAFSSFYELHSERMLAYMMRRVYDAEVAFDLTAETFAQAYVARRRFRGATEAEAVAWLYRIASRQVSSYCKRAKVERRALRRLGVEVPRLDDEWRERIEAMATVDGVREDLRNALADLPRTQREAVFLRVVGDLPYIDVARQLQISEGAARVRVTRGLSTLADVLDGNPMIKEAS